MTLGPLASLLAIHCAGRAPEESFSVAVQCDYFYYFCYFCYYHYYYHYYYYYFFASCMSE